MRQSIHILYIPGFGDSYDGFRRWVLGMWRYRGVTVELVPMEWRKGTFQQKLMRIDNAIDRSRHKRIVLIGESAGGSMAIHTYARRPENLYKVATICGKNILPETVGDKYFRYSPAFWQSMAELNGSLAKLSAKQMTDFVSVHPLYDPVVPVKEMFLPGCRRVKLWLIGHMPTIFLAMTILSPIIIRRIR